MEMQPEVRPAHSSCAVAETSSEQSCSPSPVEIMSDEGAAMPPRASSRCISPEAAAASTLGPAWSKNHLTRIAP